MWGCSADFSGSHDTNISADVVDIVPDGIGQCADPSAVPAKRYPIGSKITADNGIDVEIADIFIPEGESGIACFNFYLGDQKLTNEHMCVQNSKVVQMSPCWYNSYEDYGVEIRFRPPDKDGIPLKVISDTVTNVVKSPVDLYEECDNFHNVGLLFDSCLKYVPHDSLEGEGVLTSGALQAFSPADQMEVGTYYLEQLGACQDKINGIFGLDTATQQTSIRYHLQHQNDSMFYIGGRALSDDYIVIQHYVDYAKEQADSLLGYVDIHDGKCHDGMVLHEGAHCSWWTQGVKSSYFWMPLQEGAARFIEVNYPIIPTPKVYLDAYLKEGDETNFQYSSEGGAKTITLKVEKISLEEIGLSLNYLEPPGGHISIKITAKPGVINNTQLYNLIIDQPIINGNEKAARFRMISIESGALPWQMNLVCKENSYNSQMGLWLDGIFYPWEYEIQGQDEGYDNPYQSLAGEFEESLYNTGACFFDGIRTAYKDSGGDFATFFPKLTASLKSHASQPLPVQYEGQYCVLEEVQRIADEDLGPLAFDVKEYAEKFGYSDASPWCIGLNVYRGDTNNFGKIP